MKLKVETEQVNQYDKDAMIVGMSEADEVDTHLLQKLTNQKRCQKVKDVTGKVVGRVPAN